jgi:hypothetical protein
LALEESKKVCGSFRSQEEENFECPDEEEHCGLGKMPGHIAMLAKSTLSEEVDIKTSPVETEINVPYVRTKNSNHSVLKCLSD